MVHRVEQMSFAVPERVSITRPTAPIVVGATTAVAIILATNSIIRGYVGVQGTVSVEQTEQAQPGRVTTQGQAIAVIAKATQIVAPNKDAM